MQIAEHDIGNLPLREAPSVSEIRGLEFRNRDEAPAAQIRLQPAVPISPLSLQSRHSDMPKCAIAVMPSSGNDAAVAGAGIIDPTANTVKATRNRARR